MKGKNWLLVFILHPVSAAIKAIYKPQNQESTLVLSLFTGLFCFCMVAPSESMDLYRYLNSLEYFGSESISDKSDFYVFVIQKAVSTFTKNGHVLMSIFGLICGCFYAKSINILTRDISSTKLVSLVILFSSIFSLATLGGVRQCTAFYLMFWGAISYFYTQNWRYLIAACASPLVHFSFVSYCVLLLISLYLKDKPKISLVIFGLSFVISVSGLNAIIESNLSFLGSAAEAKTIGYLEADVDEFNTQYTSSLASQAIPTFYSVELIVFLIVTVYCIFKFDRKDIKPYILYTISYVLIFLSFYNIISDIPHLGLRTQQVACALMLYPIIRFIQESGVKQQYTNAISYIILTSGFMVFWFEIRKIVEITPWTMALLPAPLAPLSDTTVYEILQMLGLQ